MNKVFEDRLHQLETKIAAVEQRNKRVELDKAWETSVIRKVIVAILTYITISVVMMSFVIPNPWINAIIPSIGFLLSTSSLSLFKSIWLKRMNNSH